MRFSYKEKGVLMETNCLLTINDPDELANPANPANPANYNYQP